MLFFTLPGLRRRAEPEPNGAGVLPCLHYPLGSAPRTAVLGLLVRAEKGIVSMPAWSIRQLESTRPEALAGSLKEIEEVASLRELGVLKLNTLSYPIVVFTRPGEARLSESDHDRLWRLYQLPVFEQIRSEDGSLLAWECEARDGFHFSPGADKHIDGFQVERSTCSCGSESARLTAAAAVPEPVHVRPRRNP